MQPITTSRNSLIQNVLRVLTRHADAAVSLSGQEFVRLAPDFRKTGLTAALQVNMPGHRFAWLVYRRGALVHAAQEDLEPLDALNVVRNALSQSNFVMHRLSGLHALMSVAIVDGMLSIEQPLNTSLDEVIRAATNNRMSGLIGVQTDRELLIWRFRDGTILNAPGDSHLPNISNFRLIRVDWIERELPELVTTRSAPPASPVVTAPTKAPEVDSSERIWSLFEVLMRSHLGDRAERMLNLLRSEYATERGHLLVERLGKQLERVAGSAAARGFREGLDRLG